MKMRVACASPARSSNSAISAWPSSWSKQLAHPVQVGDRLVVQQIGLAAHDQHRPVGPVAAPHRQTVGHQLRRRPVDLDARARQIADQACPPPPRSVRPDSRSVTKLAARSIACALKPGRTRQHAVLHRPVGVDDHGERLVGGQRHQAELAHAHLPPGHEHQPGARRQARQHRRGFAQHAPRPGRRRPAPPRSRGVPGWTARPPASCRRRTA